MVSLRNWFGHYSGGSVVRATGEWFRNTTGGLPRQFWYLFAGTLINRVGAFVLIVHLISGPARERQAAALRPTAVPVEPMVTLTPTAPEPAEAAATAPTPAEPVRAGA